ncbi:restriction alleviation protein, Lar family [Ochrobactrum sp. MR28]|nr:restriction alleviation protein, Lar family [Ochrobactrum sp. MR28]MBX8818969.1 restriction alleviation protein, Lar family [Ochrobactrum sp. MR31]
MKTELKPCPFCGGRAERIEITKDDDFGNIGGAAIECQQCRASSHVEFGRMENLVSVWNTRAVPDVQELAALKKYTVVSPFAPIGEYVLHSEVAEFIAAKGDAINGLSDAVEECNSEIEALTVENVSLKNKLAQYEGQKPLVRNWQPTHQHVKRGTEYHLIGIGKMQTERWIEPGIYPKPGIADMREVVIYRSVDDGSLWVRPREEFDDGRFITLPAAPTTEAGK